MLKLICAMFMMHFGLIMIHYTVYVFFCVSCFILVSGCCCFFCFLTSHVPCVHLVFYLSCFP